MKLNKDAKNHSVEKGNFFPQMLQGKLDIHMQRMKLDPYLISHTEIKSKT